MVRDGPENWKGLQGVNDWEKVNLSLENPRWRYGGGMEEGPYDGMQFREGVLRMFSEGYLTKWGDFASVRFDPNAGDNVNFLSLEYIHNNIHVSIMTTTHMELLTWDIGRRWRVGSDCWPWPHGVRACRRHGSYLLDASRVSEIPR